MERIDPILAFDVVSCVGKDEASAPAGDLWAITSYFNPLSYRRRRDSYRIFRDRLGVPLVTVELGYGPQFELGKGDADILIQRRGGDVLWQKERLLNIALDALPESCTKVAWIDCDVVFGEQDWPERASRLLDRVPLVQLFSRMYYLPADASSAENWTTTHAETQRESLAYAMASGLDNDAWLPSSVTLATGLAWAARRELLQRHRFYDACIIGGGDRAMATAAYGCFDHLIRRQTLNERQFAHYLSWAKPFHKDVRRKVGVVDGELFHLWHGALKHRRWRERFPLMAPFQFDPYSDSAMSEEGVWRWTSNKLEMHDYAREHFALRREDD